MEMEKVRELIIPLSPYVQQGYDKPKPSKRLHNGDVDLKES